MTVLLVVAAVIGAWLVIAVALALLIGRTVKVADRQHARTMAYRSAQRSPRVLAAARRA